MICDLLILFHMSYLFEQTFKKMFIQFQDVQIEGDRKNPSFARISPVKGAAPIRPLNGFAILNAFETMVSVLDAPNDLMSSAT